MFTILEWIFIILWIAITVAISIGIAKGYIGNFDKKESEKKAAIINFVISIVVIACITVGLAWYNTSTASGIRKMKDYNSNLSNGIDREITITAEDGREIFHYEGKIDIESDHEDNYIKFEGEDGKRYLIYYGIQDTITIIEK